MSLSTSAQLLVVCGLLGIWSTVALCPGNTPCSGHGTCGSWDRCTCYANWQGFDCAEKQCPYAKAFADVVDLTDNANREQHYYAECSNQGICDRSRGECNCFAGFEGKACSRLACPERCNGHGTCELISELNSGYSGWDADKIQLCSCDPGWTGPSCKDRMCKTGDDPLTLNVVGGNTIQENEVQELAFTDSGSNALTGTFALKYTDWRGEVLTTYAIDIATATAITIQEALTALPNNRVPSVTVTASGAGASSGALTFSVTFDDDATPGEQPALEIDNTACTTAGCQPVITSVTSAGTTGATVTTATAGTEENEECAGRGKCNKENGLCECFPGYYGEACQMQTIIT